MQDTAISLLLNQLQATPKEAKKLWFADENSDGALDQLSHFKHHLTLLTHRFDIHRQAQNLGLNSIFNDVDFNEAGNTAFDAVFIRISKEKPVTHHAINQSAQILSDQGNLHLAGYKNEGIKTYAQKTAALFGQSHALQKIKDAYINSFSHPKNHTECNALATNDYTKLRLIGEHEGCSLVSKPGVFGFEKIDQGSALLLTTAHNYLIENKRITQQTNLLDLGCGYGLLTLCAQKWGIHKITATDNNAAALAALQAGVKTNKPDATIHVLASDAGKEIEGKYDIILCNPPFHQGFDISSGLTHKFLHNTQRLLAPNGVALFVVNSFIALEKKAKPIFKHQKTLCNNKRFKVILLKNNAA